MRYFFYGTLRDAALRRAVLGRLAGGLKAVRAVLDGYEARLAAGRRYPLAVRRRAAVLPGLLVTLPGRRAAARINAYEGPEYRRVRRVVRLAQGPRVSAAIFLPTARARASRTVWRIENWRRDAARLRRIFRRARLGARAPV
ncbi:MAG: gamma-glutamylcyclotransferase [Alphaproteobacteria bacterium]|nr:gamma-glutamylcyclotransferase [Alphaproteobacteria bacterium]